MREEKICILGAGISGLYSALRLNEYNRNNSIKIIEKTSSVGGMAKSIKYKDFILDFGPHKIYSIIPGILDEYQRIMDDQLIKVKKRNSIFLECKFVEFPIRISKILSQLNLITITLCGVSFLKSKIKRIFSSKKMRTYEDYFITGFGDKAYNLIFRDLAFKVWGDPRELSEELGRRRVPIPNVGTLIKSFFRKNKPTISANEFLYPKKGFGYICEYISNKLEKNNVQIYLNSIPESIIIKNNVVTNVIYKTSNNNLITEDVGTLISTISLIDLISIIKPEPPKDIINATNCLKFRGLVLVFLFFDKDYVLKDNWIFFPEKKYIFNRISEPKLSSVEIAPKGKTYIIAEVTLDYKDELFNDEGNIVEKVISDLETVGLIKRNEIIETLVKKAKRVYPIYDLDYKKNLNIIMNWLDNINNLYTIGRLGLYNYNNTDHCIHTGMKLIDLIISKGTKQDWKVIRESFDNYSIID